MAKAMGFMEAARIQSEINRLFDNLLDMGAAETGSASWIPNADILESGEELVLRVELPGVRAEHVELSIDGGNAIISGEKYPTSTDRDTRFSLSERQFGKFRRVIALGVPVNTRQADAQMIDGLLEVRFPKVPNRRGEVVRIEVQGE